MTVAARLPELAGRDRRRAGRQVFAADTGGYATGHGPTARPGYPDGGPLDTVSGPAGAEIGTAAGEPPRGGGPVDDFKGVR